MSFPDKLRHRTWTPARGRNAWLEWRDATRAAILRECARADRYEPASDEIRPGGKFTFQGIVRRELLRVVHDTATVSSNPTSVLRQCVQKLEATGEIRRVGDGAYRLTPRFRLPRHWTT